jgi:hypothetical protein
MNAALTPPAGQFHALDRREDDDGCAAESMAIGWVTLQQQLPQELTN